MVLLTISKKLKQSDKITRIGGARYGGEWKVN